MNHSLQSDDEQAHANVDLSSLLIADYTYIAQTAFQANEERAKSSTFYLLSVASVLATIWASNPEKVDLSKTALAFSIVFGALGIWGVITLMQLARLRSAWFDSIMAMNYIKEYAKKNQNGWEIESPFPWTRNSLPKRFEPKSVAAFLIYQVVIMSAIMGGACIFYVGQYIDSNSHWLIPGLAVACLWGGVGVTAYLWALKQRE